MRITAKGSTAFIKLEDKSSGEGEPRGSALRGEQRCAAEPGLTPPGSRFPGELFAQAPVEQFPGIAVEGVTDSSRYFVIRIEDGNGASRTPWDPSEPSLLLFEKHSCFPWWNIPCTGEGWGGAEGGTASVPRL